MADLKEDLTTRHFLPQLMQEYKAGVDSPEFTDHWQLYNMLKKYYVQPPLQEEDFRKRWFLQMLMEQQMRRHGRPNLSEQKPDQLVPEYKRMNIDRPWQPNEWYYDFPQPQSPGKWPIEHPLNRHPTKYRGY